MTYLCLRRLTDIRSAKETTGGSSMRIYANQPVYMETAEHNKYQGLKAAGKEIESSTCLCFDCDRQFNF